MGKEGHKIIKIVMTRKLTGTFDNLSYPADCWQTVKKIIRKNQLKPAPLGAARGLVSPSSVPG